MSNFEFSDGTKRLLRGHPALAPERTRELGAAFNAAQEAVCGQLAAMGYPLERTALDLKAGTMAFFREGSDEDRKRNSGKKASYRFAGITPGQAGEFERRLAENCAGASTVADFAAWQASFLMRFTFEVIEQVALRAFHRPDRSSGSAPLAEALADARKIRDEIVAGNLLLVAKIVIKRSRFNPTMVPDDLFAAGTDGLMIAVNRYDSAVGNFSTYATPWVKMAVDRFVANTRHVIRIPIGMQEKVRRQRSGAGGGEGDRASAALLIPEVQSLEDPVPGFAEGELRLEDVVADPLAQLPAEALEQADIAGILRERVRQLDVLKQFVVAMRNDIGDAAALGAILFQEEAALSLARGREISAAAAKSLDEPARIQVADSAAATSGAERSAAPELAFAI